MQTQTSAQTPIAIYQTADGSISTDVRLEGDTVWLTQQQDDIRQFERTLSLFQQNLIEQVSLPEARGLVNVIAGYARNIVVTNNSCRVCFL